MTLLARFPIGAVCRRAARFRGAVVLSGQKMRSPQAPR